MNALKTPPTPPAWSLPNKNPTPTFTSQTDETDAGTTVTATAAEPPVPPVPPVVLSDKTNKTKTETRGRPTGGRKLISSMKIEESIQPSEIEASPREPQESDLIVQSRGRQSSIATHKVLVPVPLEVIDALDGKVTGNANSVYAALLKYAVEDLNKKGLTLHAKFFG